MKKVTILGLYNSMATTIFGPMDILNQAGRLWNRVNKTTHTLFFDVTIATEDGRPIRTVNHIHVKPHCSINEIENTDLLNECFLPPRDHADPLVAEAQAWMEQNTTQAMDYDHMADQFEVSRRSLERRFKQAIGRTPLSYLQKLRVEQAKQMLEEGSRSFNEITYEVGYEDILFFRKIFIRFTGLRPKEYQRKFECSWPTITDRSV